MISQIQPMKINIASAFLILFIDGIIFDQSSVHQTYSDLYGGELECISKFAVFLSATLIFAFIYVNIFEDISNWTWNIFNGNKKNK